MKNDGLISRRAVLAALTDISYNHCKTEGEAILIDTAKTLVTVMPSAQPDGEYISRQAVTESDLIDWYINSVDESEPVWTEEHIHELFNDFYLIPKED